MEPIYILKGAGGQLEVYNDKVIIKRKGFMAKSSHGWFKGDKTIYIKQISGIEVKPAGGFVNGYIQFTLPGGNESRKGLMDATRDENTIMYYKKDNDLVQKIKAKIEEIQQEQNNENKQVVNQVSPADEIKKYKELLDDGIITSEEFAVKKKQLLNI